MSKFLVMYSGGMSSYAAARRVVEEHGSANVELLFADTIIEDDDLYRFLVESALSVYGFESSYANEILRRISELTPIEDESWGALRRRKEELEIIRAQAMNLIRGLHWIADGRTPWEVFRSERFIGNTKVDPCSKILKRQLMDRWRNEHCEPVGTTLVFGLDWTERERIARHRKRLGAWRSVYPLDERPYLTQEDIGGELAAKGIARPRLYELNFPHNNCGGLCVKAGLAQMRHLARTLPARYRWHERQELAAMSAIGESSQPILRLRDKGRSKPITMRAFRQAMERQPMLYDADGWGCKGGCAIDDE